MSTIKTFLTLLAVFCAYGIVGKMDYEDAVMLESEQQTIHSDCPATDSTPSARPNEIQSQAWEEFPEHPESRSTRPCDIFIY